VRPLEHSHYQIFSLLLCIYQLHTANEQYIAPPGEIRSAKNGEDKRRGYTTSFPQTLKWQKHFAIAYPGHAVSYTDFYKDLMTYF